MKLLYENSESIILYSDISIMKIEAIYDFVDVGKFYSFWGQLILTLLVQVGGLGYMTATTVLLLLIPEPRIESFSERVGLAFILIFGILIGCRGATIAGIFAVWHF